LEQFLLLKGEADDELHISLLKWADYYRAQALPVDQRVSEDLMIMHNNCCQVVMTDHKSTP
jgi:hypothetical protein